MNYNQEMDIAQEAAGITYDTKNSRLTKLKSFWREIGELPLKDKILFYYGWIGFIISFLVALFLFSGQPFLGGQSVQQEYPNLPSFTVDHSGEHCDNNRIIINYGIADCATAMKITNSYDFHQAATVVIDNYTCAPPQDVSLDHFFDVWCTRLYRNAITSFFASASPGFYANFPAGFSHWLPDVSAYARIDHPGIDFRTENNTIQCIVTGAKLNLLECAGERIPGTSSIDHMPNNMVVFTGDKKPVPSFGNSIEFSYGQRRILSDGNTIFYKNFICSATTTQMRCANISAKPHGFTVSPTVFSSY